MIRITGAVSKSWRDLNNVCNVFRRESSYFSRGYIYYYIYTYIFNFVIMMLCITLNKKNTFILQI